MCQLLPVRIRQRPYRFLRRACGERRGKIIALVVQNKAHLDKYEQNVVKVTFSRLKLDRWFTGFQLNDCCLWVSREKLIRTFSASSENCGRVVDIFIVYRYVLCLYVFILDVQQSMLRASQRVRDEERETSLIFSCFNLQTRHGRLLCG